MQFRRNNFDVTNTVNVTDSISVGDAIEKIFLNLFPNADAATLLHAMSFISRLYRGEHPDYFACDTGYHDMQHILDVTLASARDRKSTRLNSSHSSISYAVFCL